jgi:hypothetical protein
MESPVPPTPQPVPVDTIASILPVTIPQVPPQLSKTSAGAPFPAGPFASTTYRFTTGLRAGELASVRGAGDEVLLSYRSFASITGIVAALLSAIVACAGVAAVLFLIQEQQPLRALAALVLTLLFAFFIALLVPRVQVTLYDDGQPALTLSQRTVLPRATYSVSTPNGATLAEIRKSFFSRLGRNRWLVFQDGRLIGEAAEESLGRALIRKVLGKFSRSFEENIRIDHGGIPCARIIRRPEAGRTVDILEITNDAFDRRIAVALATLILGREP